jgi:hypothetical protein
MTLDLGCTSLVPWLALHVDIRWVYWASTSRMTLESRSNMNTTGLGHPRLMQRLASFVVSGWIFPRYVDTRLRS